jgi:hypothetical protein
MSSSASRSIFQVWIDALTKPTEANYASIVEEPGVSAGKAFLWVFLAATISFPISLLEQITFGGFSRLLSAGQGESIRRLGGSLIYLVIGAPVFGIFAVIGLIIAGAVTQWIAGMLGGKGTFTKLVYAVAAYSAPFSLIAGVLGGIPFVNFCIGIAGLYTIFLEIVAVKAVNRFDWGKAVIAALAVPVIFTIVCCCLGFVLSAVLGPIVGNVLSQINQQLVP